MDALNAALDSAAQAVEGELSKFDALQVIQSKLAEVKQLVADFQNQPVAADPAADPNAAQPEA